MTTIAEAVTTVPAVLRMTAPAAEMPAAAEIPEIPETEAALMMAARMRTWSGLRILCKYCKKAGWIDFHPAFYAQTISLFSDSKRRGNGFKLFADALQRFRDLTQMV